MPFVMVGTKNSADVELVSLSRFSIMKSWTVPSKRTLVIGDVCSPCVFRH